MMMPRFAFKFLKAGLPFLLLLMVNSVLADNLTVSVGGEDEVPIIRYPSDGDTLILWTPSSFGMQPPARLLAQELVFDKLEVWLADLHEAFFVSRGRSSSRINWFYCLTGH
jgi:hypothetical protein